MKKLIKKLTALLVLISMCSGCFQIIVHAESIGIDSLEKIAENSGYILYANTENGEIAVTDKSSGFTWWSNPPWREDEAVAKGVQKMNMFSQLLVKYYDAENNAYFINNYTGSIRKDGIKSEKIKDGIRFVFNFPEKKFQIPVQYTLMDDYLKAELITSEVKEDSEFKIIDISFLPFFGAGGSEDKGYIMVPDGSGALINFNNGKMKSAEYNEPIYGRDASLNEDNRRIVKENIYMPVFGIKNSENAFLAVVDKGDFLGSISAFVSGKYTSCNNAYSWFQFRGTDGATLAAKDWRAKTVILKAQEHVSIKSCEVRFYFLNGLNADYSGMAERYRQYLMEEKGLSFKISNGDIPFYVELYGAVKRKKSVLGLPVTVMEPLTTYMEAADIIKQLENLGINNIAVKYTSWMKNGMEDKGPASAKLEGKLGGKSGFNELLSFISSASKGEGSSIKLFPDVDFLNVYRNGNGFLWFKDAVKAVTKVLSLQFSFKANTYDKDYRYKPWYLLSPEDLHKIAGKFVRSFTKLNVEGISIASMGKTVYSDYKNSGIIDREETGDIFKDQMKALKGKIGSVMLDKASAYGFPYADHIVNIPLYSSRFDIEDEEIPFYGMVLHGLVSCSSPQINNADDENMEFLKALEVGAYPYYTWTAKDSSVLKDTKYNYLYNTNYKMWIDSAVKVYKEVNGVLSGVMGQKITSHHKLQDGVYETVYENGIRIIINYNEASAYADGNYIGGRSYTVIPGGN